MYVVCVSVHVKPAFVEPFIEATIENARGSRGEPGNLRFDVLRREDDPNRLFLYEVYRNRDAFAEHQGTQHYLRWRETVKDWMEEPRVGLRHVPAFFGDENLR